MTSTADTEQHPDVSEISDLTDGLLSPSRTAEVREHLDSCALCADVHASLEEIRGLLGTLPGPSRMPDDVAERIDGALAAEALRQADPPEAAAAHVSRETSPPARTPAGHPRAATGPGRSAGVRRRRRNAVLGAVFGTAAVGVSVLLLRAAAQAPSDNSAADAQVSKSSVAAAKDFSDPFLRSQVDALLAGNPAAKHTDSTHRNGAASDNSPLLGQVPVVPPCVEQGTGRNAAVLAVEQGTYEGRKAYLLVLPHPTDSAQVQAYVIDASCVSATPPAKGKLLLTHVYPRG